jgi:hypothetical protein
LNQLERYNIRIIFQSFHMATFFRLRFQEQTELQLMQRIWPEQVLQSSFLS